MAKANKGYSADNMKTKDGLQAVRDLPGMYIGSTTSQDGEAPRGLSQIIQEIISNSTDEIRAGFGSFVRVTLKEDDVVIVEDDGRGLPFGKKGSSAIRAATVLHTSGKFDSDTYKKSGGQHGVGMKATNAVSEWFTLDVVRDKKTSGDEDLAYTIYFEQDQTDKQKVKQRKRKRGEKTGTKVSFKPDPTIFDRTEQDFKAISRRLQNQAFLAAGVKYELIDERVDEDGNLRNEPITYLYEDGISDQVRQYIEGDQTIGSKEPIYFDGTIEFDKKGRFIGELTNGNESNNTIDVRVSLIYTETIDDTVFSYANDIPTPDGGPHVNGLYLSIRDVFIDYALSNKMINNRSDLTGNDTKDGLTAVLAVDIPTNEQPTLSFESQTKEKLGTAQAKDAVMAIITDRLTTWLNDNKKKSKAIVEKMIEAKDARTAAKEAREVAKASRSNDNKKDALLKSSKLAEANGNDPLKNELFLVEGDSAGGSAKAARDPETQAILPLKGKPKNVHGSKLSTILKNEEWSTIVNVIAAGVASEFQIEDRQYDKIIIMADADDDGYHIQMLLILGFWTLMPDMLRDGHIYIANPPLYRLDYTHSNGKREKVYALDDNELEELRKGRENWSLTRMKGLGEMNADELENTTMRKGENGRFLTRLVIEDEAELKDTIATLLGGGSVNIAKRKSWIDTNVDMSIVDEEEGQLFEYSDDDLFKLDDGELIGRQETIETLARSGNRYARKLLIDRAIPDVRDGIAPGRRALLYTMYDMGVLSNKPTRKNAQIVGKAMGSYWPHGDSSIYGTQVIASQWFKNNIPTVDFQGNNGSLDGDGAAAYRYTESRLTKMGQRMVEDVKNDTIDMRPNYNNDNEWPKVLPADWPVLFTNGHFGIAYGYSTKIAMFNPYELMEAAIYLNKSENARLSTLLKHYIKGPDFPTGGTIFGNEGLQALYETGKGSFNIRAKTEFDGDDIVITEIPYDETVTGVKESIVKVLVDEDLEKNIKGNKIKDSSKGEHVEIRIPLRKNANKEAILGTLYDKSKMQVRFHGNHNAIVDGAPKLIALDEYLREFVKFRREVIQRRLENEKKKREARLEIVQGNIKLGNVLHEVIEMIADEQKGRKIVEERLVKEFSFTERQAENIAGKALYSISKQDFDRFVKEEKDLKNRIGVIDNLLTNKDDFIQYVSDEMRQTRDLMKEEGYHERKSVIIDDSEVRTFEVDHTDLIEEKTVHVVVKPSTVQRMTETVYENNREKYKGEIVHVSENAKTTQVHLALSKQGFAFQRIIDDIDHQSIVHDTKDWHDDLTNFALNDTFIGGGVFDLEDADDVYIVSVTKFGQVKVMKAEQSLRSFDNKGYLKRGKYYNGLKVKDDEVIFAEIYDDVKDRTITLKRNSGGREVVVKLDELSVQSERASGVRKLKITKDNDFTTIVDRN